LAEAEAAHRALVSGEARGPITGLANLDRELSGVLMPGLHIVHGNVGTGKTALALQIAATCGCPAMFVTCEMSAVELLRRHTARETGTYLGRLKSGELDPPTVKALVMRACEEAPLLSFLDASKAQADPNHLRDCAEVVKGDAAHLLIVVDSLHSWAEGMAAGASEYEYVSSGMKALRELSADLTCPIFLTGERNREKMDAGGPNTGAGSRKIEYGAETIVNLDRSSDAKPDLKGNVPITVKLAKNRHGRAGAPIYLTFNGALQRFTEAEPPTASANARATAPRRLA